MSPLMKHFPKKMLNKGWENTLSRGEILMDDNPFADICLSISEWFFVRHGLKMHSYFLIHWNESDLDSKNSLQLEYVFDA